MPMLIYVYYRGNSQCDDYLEYFSLANEGYRIILWIIVPIHGAGFFLLQLSTL
jgi:hypothetical protein